ncbi:hypothetical protein L195_g039167, partial [Trifolium pratense]
SDQVNDDDEVNDGGRIVEEAIDKDGGSDSARSYGTQK